MLEYEYWAKIERQYGIEAERKYRERQGPWSVKKMLSNRFSKGHDHERSALPAIDSPNEKMALDEKGVTIDSGSKSSLAVSDEEWATAARALRTASWGTIFFLVTTDILSWSSCPFVFASV